MDEYADMCIDAMNALAVESLAAILSFGDKKNERFLRSLFPVFAKYGIPASKWTMFMADLAQVCEEDKRAYDEDGVSLGCQE